MCFEKRMCTELYTGVGLKLALNYQKSSTVPAGMSIKVGFVWLDLFRTI